VRPGVVDPSGAAVMLDKLLHRTVVINLDGEFCRLSDIRDAADVPPPSRHRHPSTDTLTPAIRSSAGLSSTVRH